jgi:hypothetical protein
MCHRLHALVGYSESCRLTLTETVKKLNQELEDFIRRQALLFEDGATGVLNKDLIPHFIQTHPAAMG